MLISFIITYYNESPEMLLAAVDSVMQLSLPEKEREIIVVDDGSAEDILTELPGVKDDIIYLRQRNTGLSSARNMGLLLASGQYVQFIDANDYLIPSVYEHCLDIARFEDPDIVLFEFTDKEGYVMDVTKSKTEGPVDGSLWLKNNNVNAKAWAYLFKKKILLNLRFEKSLHKDDEAFTPQLILRAERLFYTDSKAYFSRKSEAVEPQMQSEESILKKLNDMEKTIFQLHNVASSQSHTNRQALQRRVSQLTLNYLYNVIKETHDRTELESRIARLREENLFPVAETNCSLMYRCFGKLVNNKLGRVMLCKIL